MSTPDRLSHIREALASRYYVTRDLGTTGMATVYLANDIHRGREVAVKVLHRINEIVHCTRGITADTALRLARYFGNTERFWFNRQARFDLKSKRDALGSRLEREVVPFARAS